MIVDTESILIDKIEVASKEIIDVSNLPSSAKMVLDQDFADSSIESIQYAKGLGYKVSLFTNDESITESKSDLFFSSKGEKLDDDNVERKAKRLPDQNSTVRRQSASLAQQHSGLVKN